MKYGTIVADPPWPLRWSGGVGGAHRNPTPLRYGLMTLEAIMALPVQDLADDEAHLFLWVTPEMHRKGQGEAVAIAWGFDPVDEIIWEKPNIGMGVFPRHVHEPLLIARRGDWPFTGPRNVRSVQKWPQVHAGNGGGKVHSAKPDAALDLIEQVSPGPYVELFARRARFGWDYWGDQSLGTATMSQHAASCSVDVHCALPDGHAGCHAFPIATATDHVRTWRDYSGDRGDVPIGNGRWTTWHIARSMRDYVDALKVELGLEESR